MAKGIEIGIASDTKAFKQGIDAGIIEPLDDAEKSLTDLGKNRGLDKLEDGLEDAQQETERLKKETKQTADAIEKEYRSAYKKVGKSADDGFDEAGAAATGFKDEARQNFAEAASSFDGSMDSIGDAAQSTLGGLASSVSGPLGIALAGLGALGGTFAKQWTDAAEATEERMSDMYDDMLESGMDYLSQDFLNRELAALRHGDQEQYNSLLQLSKDLNIDLSDVLIAQVSKGEERERVEAALTEEYREQLELRGKMGKDGFSHQSNDAAAVAHEMELWLTHFEKLDSEQSDALDSVREIRDAQEQVNAKFSEEGELIQANNEKLSAKPIEIPVEYKVDTSALERARRDYAILPVKIAYNDGRTGRKIV